MPRTSRRLAILVLIAAPALGYSQQQQFPPSPVTRLFAEFWEERLAERPEQATARGRRDHNDRWRDWSPAGLARARETRERYLARLRGIPHTGLSTDDRLSLELLDYLLTAERDGDTLLPFIDR